MKETDNFFLTPSVSELPKAVEWVLAQANGRKKIMLYGSMGAGKTTFTRAFCAHLGVKEGAKSPTFSLVNEYEYEEKGIKKLIRHLDLYRLKNLEEALDIGIEDFLYDDAYCLIEWANIIEPILPEDVLSLKIEILENFVRKIVIL